MPCRMRRRSRRARSGCRRREDEPASPAQSRHKCVRRSVRCFLQGISRPPGGCCTLMIDTLRLTAEEAAGMIERREMSAEELHAAYAGRDDDVHAYLKRLDFDGAAGVPIALKD